MIVEPIRDNKKIEDMKTYLLGNSVRDYCLFVVGINFALRISDLIKLKWSDVLKENKKTFKNLRIQEGKTGKTREIKINKNAKKAFEQLVNYYGDINLNDYIFQSREGKNKPISRQRATQILKDSAKAVGIDENINTHSLRKIWGWNAWRNGYSPALIMDTLNHSNLGVTRRYLGIRQDEINSLYENLNI